MDNFSGNLQEHIRAVEQIGMKIECGEAYIDELRRYLPSLQQMITQLFERLQSTDCILDLDPGFVLQVLNDIIYGMEYKDSVFLLDVLRYGLLEIYDYIAAELQSEGANEPTDL